MRISSLVAGSLIAATLSIPMLGTSAGAETLPITTQFQTAANGDTAVAAVTLPAVPELTLGVGYAHSDATSIFGGSSTAISANFDQNVSDTLATPDQQIASAPPTSDPAAQTLVDEDFSPVLDIGAITGDTFADYGSAISCPSTAPTQVLADALTDVADLTVADLPGIGAVAQVGHTTVRTVTKLVENPGDAGHWDVHATTTTVMGDTSLLGGAAVVHIPEFTTYSHSDGTTGTAGFEPSAPTNPTITVAGTPTEIPLNGVPQSIPVPIPGFDISVTVTGYTPTNLSSGAIGESDLDALVKVEVHVGLLLPPTTLADVTLQLAPQDSRALAPAGGVECLAITDAPVITSPTNGSTTNDQTPTITGTATYGDTTEPGTITVKDGDGNTICTAEVQSDGSWSCTPASNMALGTYTITAVETSTTATSPTSAPVTFTIIDDIAPAAPAITTPADGSTTTDTTPAISGTAEANSSVTVYDTDGTTVLCTATTDGSGNWTCTPASPMAQGAHTITATATDASNNTSVASAPNTFTIDSIAPNAPVISTPADGSSTSDTTPQITGTAEANSTVTVYDTDGTTVLCTTTADGAGNWACTSSVLTEGAHTITATSTDAAGNTSVASAPHTFTVDTAAPAAPVIQSPANGSSTNDSTPDVSGTAEAGSTVTVTEGGAPICTAVTDGTGHWTCTPSSPLAEGPHTFDATATDAAGNTSSADSVTFTVDTVAPAAPVIATPADGTTTTDTTPPITGTAEINSTVKVYDTDGTTVLCTTTADGGGNWSCTSTVLAQGSHTITATSTDAAGNVSPLSNANTFIVDSIAPNAPVILTPADGSSTNDTTPDVSGTAEAGSTVTVTEGGVLVCTALTAPDGTWTCTPAGPLTEGPHTFDATATDGAGNISTADSTTFTVDTTAPAAPVITGPANGSTTGDTTPPISGTGEPGATVTVDEGGTTVCTAVVAQDSTWSCSPASPLPDGDHTVTATQTDEAGNTSPASAPVTFTVDSDLDDDGLTNDQEDQLGTDPLDPDTDNDGLTDGAEVNGFLVGVCGRSGTTFTTNPLVADTDADGLNDGREATGSLNTYGAKPTNPIKPDTDGEGLKDGGEVKGVYIGITVTTGKGSSFLGKVKTNPCKADTDTDGLSDYKEKVGTKVNQKVYLPKGKTLTLRLLKSNPTAKDTDRDGLQDKPEVTGSANVDFNHHKSDPAFYDTDRGGVSDGVEVKAHSDPTNVLSTPTNPRAVLERNLIG